MDNRDLSSLLDYYRIRLSSYDKERLDWIGRLERLNIRIQDRHMLQLELKSKLDEIVKLKEEKKELTNVINKEREKGFILKQEVSYYKERSENDRKRILQLLKLTRPIEQNIGLSYNTKPNIIEKYNIDCYDHCFNEINENRKNIKRSKDVQKKSLYKSKSKSEYLISSCKDQSREKKNIHTQHIYNTYRSKSKEKNNNQPVIRTVYMIGDKLNIDNQIVKSPKTTSILSSTRENSLIESEVTYLKDQISKIKDYYSQLTYDNDENYKEIVSDLKKSIESYKEKAGFYLDENKKLEEMIYNTTKDLMIQRIEYSNNEKRLYEELELRKLSNEALAYNHNEYKNKSKMEFNKEMTLCEEKYLSTIELLKSQNKRNVENYSLLMEQYKQIQNIYNDRIKNLECKICRNQMDYLDNNKNSIRKNVLSTSMRTFNKK